MLTIKVYWGHDDYPMWSMYACDKIAQQNSQDDSVIELLLQREEDAIPIILRPGARAYIMNENGKTIDTIINHHGS